MTMCVVFDGIFGASANRSIFEQAVLRRSRFTPSRTTPRGSYPKWRRSTVVYEAELGPLADQVRTAVEARLPGAMDELGIRPFERGEMEVQLTCHGDNQHYHWHTDNGSPHTANRVVTFVYYFFKEPKAFQGGDLILYDDAGLGTTIEPQNDSMVIFASDTKHEVTPVELPSGLLEDSRFTLNGWLRRRVAPSCDYFDAKIFDVPARLLPPTAARVSSPAASAEARRRVLRSEQSSASRDAAGSLLDLYARLWRQDERAQRVDVCHRLRGKEFFARYYFANRPVLLKGGLAHAPAVQHWTPEYLAKRCGNATVQVVWNRDRTPDYEQQFGKLVRGMPLAKLVQRLREEPESNDYYLVARSYFFEHPALKPLRRELQPPADIVSSEGRGSVKLWMGPKGTITPLHQDEHSILFGQVKGRKHFKLIPPFERANLYVKARYYSAVDVAHPDLERYPAFPVESVEEVEVEPGDLLFLPAGWWHWVKALEPSISATFSSFLVRGQNTTLRV